MTPGSLLCHQTKFRSVKINRKTPIIIKSWYNLIRSRNTPICVYMTEIHLSVCIHLSIHLSVCIWMVLRQIRKPGSSAAETLVRKKHYIFFWNRNKLMSNLIQRFDIMYNWTVYFRKISNIYFRYNCIISRQVSWVLYS